MTGGIENNGNDRRQFITQTLKFTFVSGVIGTGLLASCGKKQSGEEKEVSPPEDLMQEHGLLNRILLIYDHCRASLTNKESFPAEALESAAGIVRNFVEDYHEKQEEDYLFRRFKKAHQLEDLVDTLLSQHQAGRRLTDQIIQLSGSSTASDTEKQQLIQALTSFNYMYRPHEAREDTVLFPAFRKIVSQNEYDSLGEEFEKNEHKRFGKDGFDMMVEKVAGIEKRLGIYELSQFTPLR
ncbi:MAG: hemerythrin [Sphingobacteriales bacterium 44-61]|nr:MAG: hemerythrin [Sphingobacteriales bacterium 44-61]